jgi:23S rRNA (cytosine1962-C5)-methyltransferase/23S rRNA (guanine2445-N2)-methyltransferase / 23S rRNA (guanine2069-N7)-methyltransferase
MSTTYLDWAKENFAENSIDFKKHEFIRADALAWLDDEPTSQKYDLIFLDPPTFSNSKKMDGTFDVERDQDPLVDSAIRLLAPQGTLYFSNNKRKFKISERILNLYAVKNITAQSIPRDFHDQKIHQCYEIHHK